MKRKWIINLTGTFLAFVTLVACAPTTEQPLDEPATNATETSPALRPAPTSPPEEKEVNVNADAAVDNAAISKEEMDAAVLIYERRGGKKGIGPSIHEWRFYGDGRIIGSDGNAWQVDPKIVGGLVDEIAASGFPQLDNSYIPEDTCCDRSTHVIVIQAAGQTHTVETLDDADMPQSLTDNLQEINDFLMSLYE
ncbi:MAG: hypothetical protein GY803_07140 [Chloroflexi bacterium]|nr:hypothetical protein [Chloroflexota bacterium]